MNCVQEERANTARAAGCGGARKTMKGRIDMHGKTLEGRMLPQAVASGKTAKDEHSPEVAVCKKFVEGREAGRRLRGRAKAERPDEGWEPAKV